VIRRVDVDVDEVRCDTCDRRIPYTAAVWDADEHVCARCSADPEDIADAREARERADIEAERWAGRGAR
jgi:uncharacterized protein CbrC (UPF0167 family)